jgi:hypothetical protein
VDLSGLGVRFDSSFNLVESFNSLTVVDANLLLVSVNFDTNFIDFDDDFLDLFFQFFVCLHKSTLCSIQLESHLSYFFIQLTVSRIEVFS